MPNVFIANNAGMFYFYSRYKKGEYASDQSIFIYPEFWLDKADEIHDSNRWGQTTEAYPKPIQDVIRLLYPDINPKAYLTWRQYKKVRQHIKNEISQFPNVSFHSTELDLTLSKTEDQVCSYSAKKECIDIPIRSKIHAWWQKPNTNNLQIVKPLSIVTLYHLNEANHPQSVCILGGGLSAVWAAKHFSKINLTVIHDKPSLTNISANSDINLSKLKLVPLKKENFVVKFNQTIEYHYQDKNITCDLYDAIGFSQSNLNSASKNSNMWDLKDSCQWIAPSNLPKGSTLHSYVQLAHHEKTFTEEFKWTPFAFCKNHFSENFQNYLKSNRIKTNDELIDLISDKILKLEDPLTEAESLSLYVAAYHEFMVSNQIDYQHFLSFIHVLAMNVNHAACPSNNPSLLPLYNELAKNLDISTPDSSSVYYSGSKNKILAYQFSEKSYVFRSDVATRLQPYTIEETKGGMFLDSANLFEAFKSGIASTPWHILSTRYAQLSTGTVFAFADKSDPNRTFCSVEFPALLKNPKVSQIIFLDSPSREICGIHHQETQLLYQGKKLIFRENSDLSFLESEKKEDSTPPKRESLSSTFIQPISLNNNLTLLTCAMLYIKDYLPWNKQRKLTVNQRKFLLDCQEELPELKNEFNQKKESRTYRYGINSEKFNTVALLLKQSDQLINRALKTSVISSSDYSIIEDNIVRLIDDIPKLTNKKLEHDIRQKVRNDKNGKEYYVKALSEYSMFNRAIESMPQIFQLGIENDETSSYKATC